MRPTLRFRPLLAAATLAVAITWASAAASFTARITSLADLSNVIAGQTFSADVVLFAGPGPIVADRFDIVVEWPPPDLDPRLRIGIVRFESLPTLYEGTDLVVGQDCDASLGSFTGACSVGVSHPGTAETVSPLIGFEFLYSTFLGSGYERCSRGSPGCLDLAFQGPLLQVTVTNSSGETVAIEQISGGPPAELYVRVIPEPSTTLLLAVGLAGLSRATGPTPRTCSPPRPAARA